MNTDGKMSYKDFIFPVNPSVIRISDKKTVAQNHIPFSSPVVTELGDNALIISGEGEFFGNGCITDFHNLQKVFQSGGGGMLYIPSQKPIYALFEALEMIGQDIDNVVKYTFRFIQCFPQPNHHSLNLCIADGTKCLWDYAYLYDMDIESLVAQNRDILRPDIPVTAGKKVLLC